MTSWAPFTKKIDNKGFGLPRFGEPINGIVVHHGAGRDVLGYVANSNPRNSHPTYHIANNGDITGVVDPKLRPISTGHNIDRQAITVEIDNSGGAPDWPVSEAALDSLVRLIAWHAERSPRRGVALNDPSRKQSEFFIAWHQQYSATACPGPFILGKLNQIAERSAATLGQAGPVPVPPIVIEPPKPVGRPVLRRGSKGASVKEAQKRLKAHGFSLGIWGADGDFGARTEGAVEAFQRSRGLVPDKIIGPKTWAELLKTPSRAGSPQATIKRPLIRRGSKNRHVGDVQRRLNRDYPAYSKLRVDNDFGPATEAVVREFQRRAGITVDGVVGPQTYSALGL